MKKSNLKSIVDLYSGKDCNEILKKIKVKEYEGKKLYTVIEEKEENFSDNKALILYGIENYHNELSDIILNYEKNKPFKYCTLYRITNDVFEEAIAQLEHKVKKNEEVGNIKEGLTSPKLYNEEDCYILKFNLQCKGVFLDENDNSNQKVGLLPLQIVIHKENQIVEFRVSKIISILQGSEQNFYHNRIDELIEWFEENTLFNIDPIDIFKISLLDKNNLIEDQDGNSVKVYGQKMELKTGSNATLDAGISEDIVLPILGDLKNLIKDNSSIFPNNHPFYDVIMEFITITEDESSYPWIQLIWLHEIKAKQVVAKFKFDIQSDKGYYLIDFLRNNAKNEEMMRVAKFIDRQCSQFESLSTAASEETEYNT